MDDKRIEITGDYRVIKCLLEKMLRECNKNHDVLPDGHSISSVEFSIFEYGINVGFKETYTEVKKCKKTN